MLDNFHQNIPKGSFIGFKTRSDKRLSKPDLNPSKFSLLLALTDKLTQKVHISLINP